MSRPSWNEYYLSIASTVATRADCTRAKHGAVVVGEDHRPISFGYNGAPSGHSGCLEGSCPRGLLNETQLAHLAGGYDDPESIGYCISVHAEANAIILAGRNACVGSTIYVTGEPCHGCTKLISAAGITRIVYPEIKPVVLTREHCNGNGRLMTVDTYELIDCNECDGYGNGWEQLELF